MISMNNIKMTGEKKEYFVEFRMIGDCVLELIVNGTYQSVMHQLIDLMDKGMPFVHDDGDHHPTIVNMRNVVSVTIQEQHLAPDGYELAMRGLNKMG